MTQGGRKGLFSLSGSVNKRDCRICEILGPNEANEMLLNSPSVKVWCALSKKGIIGSYLFEDGNVT